MLSVFATIFLGIFIEAVPFLMLGTLGSGLVEVYLKPERLQRWAPRRALPAALMGGLMGLLFPVCECGVVPLSRRLLRKGLPMPAGIAFLLAAPVLNPVVILSTAAAFGVGRVFWLRLGLTLLIALVAGLVFSAARTPWEVLRPTDWINAPPAAAPQSGLHPTPQPAALAGLQPPPQSSAHGGAAALTAARPAAPSRASSAAAAARRLPDDLRRVLLVAVDEFFEMGRYLVIGAGLAAAMQTFVPQNALLALGSGPLLSVAALMALAVVLSICSTVDAFIALGFAGAFSQGAVLAFLVFGPMVDIKSVMMFQRVFRPRPVIYLVLLPLLLSLLAGVLINFYGAV